MKYKNQKGFVEWVIIGVIGGAALAVGGFYYAVYSLGKAMMR